MKKRKKKYSKALAFQKLSKALSHRYKIALIKGSEKHVIAIYNDKVINNWSMTEARMLADVRYKWSVCVGALCRDEFGKSYIKSLEFSVDIECLSDEIEGCLTNQQNELFETLNKNQFLTMFWIASPIPNYEFKESELWTVVNHSKVEIELITESERLRGVKYGANNT